MLFFTPPDGRLHRLEMQKKGVFAKGVKNTPKNRVKKRVIFTPFLKNSHLIGVGWESQNSGSTPKKCQKQGY